MTAPADKPEQITDVERWNWVQAHVADVYLWVDGYVGYPQSGSLKRLVDQAIVRERNEESECQQ